MKNETILTWPTLNFKNWVLILSEVNVDHLVKLHYFKIQIFKIVGWSVLENAVPFVTSKPEHQWQIFSSDKTESLHPKSYIQVQIKFAMGRDP